MAIIVIIYLVSILGSYLERRVDLKKSGIDPCGVDLFLMLCPVLNTVGLLAYMSNVLKFKSSKLLKKFFMLDK